MTVDFESSTQQSIGDLPIQVSPPRLVTMALVANTYSLPFVEDILRQVFLCIDRHYSLDCRENRVVCKYSCLSLRRPTRHQQTTIRVSVSRVLAPPANNQRQGWISSRLAKTPFAVLYLSPFRVSARSHDVKDSNGPLVRHPRLHGLAGYAIVTCRAA